MKILFLAANPESTSRLNLEKEAREIQEALDISELAREFELIQKWEVRPRDFRRALLRYEPDIVHFSGHGEGESGLVIVDELSGASKAVTGEALAGLFAKIPSVKCVLLNACYAEVQAQAIVSHVNYVIGMRETIYDKAAIAFVIGFYDGLGYGRGIEEAFDLGSNAILWEYKNNTGQTRAMIPVESVQVESSEQLPEHLKPVLLKKTNDFDPLEINNQSQRKESLVISSNSREKYRARIQKYLAEGNLTPIAKWQLATLAKEQGISESEASSILEAELAKREQAKKTYGNLLKETMAKGFNPLEPRTQQDLKDLQQKLKLSDKEVEAIQEAEIQRKEEERIRQQQEVERERRQREEAERLRQEQEAYRLEQQEAERLREQNEAERLGRQSSTTVAPPTTISRKQFLKWAGWGGGGLITAVVAREIFKQPPSISVAEPKYIKPTEDGEKFAGLPLWTVEFETVTVDARGEVVKRDSDRQAKFFKEDLGNGVNLDMVSIPGGKFMMGSPEGEGRANEKPQHEVTVQPFFMGKYPITQAQWKTIASLPKVKVDLEPDPSNFKGDDLPVEQVSWGDAEEFCQRLSNTTGKEYRLPTEAEWEYACRAKTTTPFHFGETITGELANYDARYTYANEPKGEYRGKTAPVGSFPPNAFGLYDLHGNVWEWCKDNWHDNYEDAPTDGSAWTSGSSILKVRRGGSWNYTPEFCRSAYRRSNTRDNPINFLGFRVVCVASRTT